MIEIEICIQKMSLVVLNNNLLDFGLQYLQIVRSFVIRYLSSLKQKSVSTQSSQQLQMGLSRILSPIMRGEMDSNVLTKLLSVQLKGDYQQVLALSLLQDLNKLTREWYDKVSLQQSPESASIMAVFQTIVSQSLRVLNSQQQFHTIVPKQNQLLRQLLINPYIINCPSIENYRLIYRRLKDVKQFYPQTIKEQQKIAFLKAIEESIEQIAKYQITKLTEFVFNNLLNQLEVLQPTHQLVTSRLKIIKKIIKHLAYFHQDILYKSAFLIAKFSKDILQLPHLFSSIVCLYQDLLSILITRISPAPLILYNHLVINNVKKILQQKNKNTNIFALEILLNLLTKIFNAPYLGYFMKNYDCNFMQEPICQQALNLLFEFVQNRTNQKKTFYQIFKKQLKQATDNIRKFLNDIEPHIKPSSQKLSKFYEVKRKEYLEIVRQMNEKPKKLFVKLESISNRQIREEIMKKYARIAKKSAHLQIKKMIDLFSSNTPTSAQLFAEYVKLLFTNLSKDVNLQEFLRYFSSNFFLSGESQQILRVLDTINVLYYNHQTNKILKNSDSTYTFANAIILLNSDLHNPQNETKISQESFYKMCKKINNGEDLPLQILSTTYNNISKNKINTFRSKSQLYGISAANFVLICSRQEDQKLEYFDMQMRMLTDQNFYQYFIYDLLSGVIDQRETMKLQQLIETFSYDDRTYQCEVIELIRKLKTKKPHTPLHALQKILQLANFKNTKTTEKSLSYLWLAVNLLQNFPEYLPTNVICQLLIFTWGLRCQLRDDMYLRQKAQMKRVKKMLREYQKRQSRKSIMDMFSSFLSSKQNDSEPENTEQILMPGIKKMNYKILTEKIFDILMKSSSNTKGSQQRINHRQKGIEFFIGYLRNDEQKLFEEFLSILYLIFHLLWGFNPNENDSSYSADFSQVQSPTQTKGQFLRESSSKRMTSPLKQSLQLSSELTLNDLNKQSSLQQTIQDLFYELLGLKQSSITKRIQNLKKKDNKKYGILDSYCRYWVVRILLRKIKIKKGVQNVDKKQVKENHELYLLNKSIEYLQRTDKEIFVDLLYEFQVKVKQIFAYAQKLQHETQKIQEQQDIKQEKVIDSANQNVVYQEITQQTEQSNQPTQKDSGKDTLQQINQSNSKIETNQNTKNTKSQTLIQPSQQYELHSQEYELHPAVSYFIYSYRTVIQQFYVNCIRLIGRQQMNKDKKYKWIVNLQDMLKDVMENYAQKLQKPITILSEQNITVKKQQDNLKETQQQNTGNMILQKIQSNKDENKQQGDKNQERTLQNTQGQNNLVISHHPRLEQTNQQNEQQDNELMQKISRQLGEQQTEKMQTSQTDKAQKDSNLNQTKEQIQQKSHKQNLQQQKESKQNVQSQNQPQIIQKQQQIQNNQQIEFKPNKLQNQSALIKEQQEALRKLEQQYSNNQQSTEIPNLPYYMF